MTQAIIDNLLTDHDYGGWIANLDLMQNLLPLGHDKANIRMVNYRTSMYCDEIWRLATEYPERVQTLENVLDTLPE